MTLDPNFLAKLSEDRAIASATLFKHRHPQDDAWFHVEIMDLWRALDEFVLIEAFREAAKSTKSEEALCLEGCFGNFHYGLLIGETYMKACQRLAAIDYEARTNVKLHAAFGGTVLAKKSIENRVFFKSGAMLEAVGWEQELQSFKQFEHRPDLAWLDDIENQERIRDTAAVDFNMRKFWLELVPALDKMRRRIRFTQTRRAEDCMVTRFARSPEWVYRGYRICDGDLDDPRTKSNWPSRYPMEWIRAERDRFQASGMLQEFRQAYLLEVTNQEAKPFKDDMLAEIAMSPYHWMPRFAIYDPARTSNEKRTREHAKSDRYGKVVVSRMGSSILVHESGGRHWKPSEFIDDLFSTDNKHAPAKMGVEKNSLDDWLMQPVRIEMLKRGRPLPIVALSAPQDRSKEDFIMGLQPFAQAQDIILVGGRAAHPELVAEWNNFPQGPRDIMNALAYSLRMFSGQPIYPDFGAMHLADAPEPKRGETVYVGFSATTTETAWVACVRDGRRLFVAADGLGTGQDAAKDAAVELRALFPLAVFSAWAPADLHDQAQRIALVPQLRAAHIVARRGEYSPIARGCLADRLRTEWRQKRLLVVDRRAKHTLNALATGYAHPADRGGRLKAEPEPGTSRLIGEALECVAAMLDKGIEAEGLPEGANLGVTANGKTYVTAHPSRR